MFSNKTPLTFHAKIVTTLVLTLVSFALTAERWREVDIAFWRHLVSADVAYAEESGATGTPSTNGADKSKDGTKAAKKEELDACNPGGPIILDTLPRVVAEDGSDNEGEGDTEESEGEEEEGEADSIHPDRAIAEDQTFLLRLNCPVDEASIGKSVWFETPDVPGRIPVSVVSGTERERALCGKALCGEAHTLVLRARQSFPNDAQVKLVWGKGVRSKSGFRNAKENKLPFHTRKPFQIEAQCDNAYADGSCNPYRPIYLTFTEKVEPQFLWSLKLKSLATTPPNAGRIWSGSSSTLNYSDRFGYFIEFLHPFPENTELKFEIPSEIPSISGRTPTVVNELKVRTGTVPPMVKFAAPFGIVERHAGSTLPVTVRDVEDTLAGSAVKSGLPTSVEKITDIRTILSALRVISYRNANPESSLTPVVDKFSSGGSSPALSVKRPIGGKAFEVLGIPLSEPGFQLVEVKSPALGEKYLGSDKSLFVSTAALVTNLSVHFKWGRDSSLAWVTSLDNGSAVPSADVEAYNCHGELLWRGKTDADGRALIGDLPSPGDINISDCVGQFTAQDDLGERNNYEYTDFVAPIIVVARSTDDMSFVLSNWDTGIESWRYGIYSSYYNKNLDIAAHTILSRTLLKQGETANMVHLVRKRTGDGFAFLPSELLPTTVRITHMGSDEKFEFPLTWDSSGSAVTDFKIPAEAKLGQYQVGLFRGTDWPLSTGFFSVEDYRVPLMSGSIRLPEREREGSDPFAVDLSIHYLSGGGAGALPVKLRYQIAPKTFTFPGIFEDFTFGDDGQQKLRSGVEANSGEYYEYEGSSGESGTSAKLFTKEITLDRSGSSHLEITDLPAITSPANIRFEAEYKDPNGELQTIASTLPAIPSRYLVGMKLDSWANIKDSFGFNVAVVTARGKGVANVPVRVRLYQKEVYTSRKKLLGSVYGYNNHVERIEQGEICQATTAANGIARCTVKIPLSGNFILEAIATDDRGRESLSASSVWVANGDEWWFEQSDTDRIDLIAEKPQYEPGETARLQVRMPFRDANVLVTVEREGILDSFVTRLSRREPVIELPIKANYGPNIVVSALAVRGRITDYQPTALTDLGKPAFKLGITKLNIGRSGYELKVGVTTNKKVYQVREEAEVTVQVRTPDGKAPAPTSDNPREVSLAVIDEGLLELKSNDSWDLLENFLGVRGTTVRTVSAAMHVIGKRHFGLKALPFGGGGGRSFTRELFDTQVYWVAQAPLDADGKATFKFPWNDSLTGFRIAAMATAGSGRFGFGTASVRTTKDVQLFSGLPPVIREDDAFDGEVTVRNSSEREISLTVSGEAHSTEPDSHFNTDFPAQTFSLPVGESKRLVFPVTAPQGVAALEYKVFAKEGSVERDSIRFNEKVRPRVPVTVRSASLHQLEHPLDVDVATPESALPGRGRIALSLSPSLTASLSGVKEYMRHYPFICLEQRTSKAVALNDADLFARLVAELPNFIDSQGFAKYFPTEQYGSEVLTAYVLSAVRERGWSFPPESESRFLQALEDFVEGRVTKSTWTKDRPNELLIRKLAALEALARYDRASAGMASALWLDPDTLPTSSVIDLWNITLKLNDLPGRSTRLAAIEKTIRSRLTGFGTILGFSSEYDSEMWWMLSSPDVSVMRFLLSVLELPNNPWKKDLGRLMRAAIERQRDGHWDLTLANVWGTLTLEKFASVVEAGPVIGSTAATLEGKSNLVEWLPDTKVLSMEFGLPKAEAKLNVLHSGSGKPWLTVRTEAAVPITSPIDQGYKVTKRVSALDQKTAGLWLPGDVIRVELEVDASADRSWVVIDDPIPAGSSLLGSGLNRAGTLTDQTAANQVDEWQHAYPIFEERAYEYYRAYFDYLPKGHYRLAYTIRLNTPGSFALPQTRIEAMYSPEMFGELPNQTFTIEKEK